ncbi:hypothetical protein ACH5RR_019255 [Cinchona calisaya]|uniref:RRM domain-containing protein n=1 Tax=Cinchona calisaya TaxID=153742 RepID=A0ABD2ZNV7_9GENT
MEVDQEALQEGDMVDCGRHKDQNHESLLVRNIPLDCRPEELRVPFERFGLVRDVYLPKDYHTGEPRGFAFVQFVDPYDAVEAQYHMNGQIFAGREISVVVAAETRKRPKRCAGNLGLGHFRSGSRSRSPRYSSGSRSRYRSRSHSPAPRGRSDYSLSPARRHTNRPRSPRDHLQDRDLIHTRRSYSPGYNNVVDQNGNDYAKKTEWESGDAIAHWRSSPGQASRSPSGSRSRTADISPRHP